MYLYNNNCPRIKPGNPTVLVWRRGRLVPQRQPLAYIRRRGAWLGVGGSRLHCGPAVLSLKPLVGDGEKNGETPVSPPQTGCPKPLCSSCPHCAAGANEVVCVASLTPVPGACLGFKLSLHAPWYWGSTSAPPDKWSLAGGRRQVLSCPTALRGGDRCRPLQIAPLT